MQNFPPGQLLLNNRVNPEKVFTDILIRLNNPVFHLCGRLVFARIGSSLFIRLMSELASAGRILRLGLIIGHFIGFSSPLATL